MKMSIKLIALTGAVLAASGASAADPTELERVQAETALSNARAAQQTAKTAEFQTKLAALGLTTDATGKTELKENGGEMEGFMLASGTLRTAAAKIATNVTAKAGERPVALLDGDEVFDLLAVASLRLDLANVAQQAKLALESNACKAPAKPGDGAAPAAAAAIGALPIIGAVLGALKTDTEIRGFAGSTIGRPLVNAVAGTSGATWIVPGEMVLISGNGGPLETAWTALQKSQLGLVRCRNAKPAPATPDAAQIDAAIAAIAAFNTRAASAGETASPLAQAIQMEALAARQPLVLRLYVEKSGGSLLLRKNLWTALGAPAVGITGGAVITWRLTDPALGEVKAAGLLVCRTALTSMRAVHAGTVGVSDCAGNVG